MTPRLDRRITIERRSASKESTHGSLAFTYTPFVTVWAERRDEFPNRAESAERGLERSRNLVRYRIRWLEGITETMRVRDDGQLLQIVGGPQEIGRREWLQLMCERSTTERA